MKDTPLVKVLLVCLLVALPVSPLLAYWDEPLFLAELNDFENDQIATRPTISVDENTIFFVRRDNQGLPRAWQAERDPNTGVFENARILSELEKEAVSMYGAWMSEDNKRLYYCGCTSNWERKIWLATRNNPSEPWNTVRRHYELEVATMLRSCSLSGDERYIMYEASPKTEPRQFKIYFATRNSTGDSFSAPQEVYELNAIGANSPTISPDGLTVYFFISNDDTGLWDLWSGQREAITEPFSNFMPMDDINAYGDGTMGWCSPSWDGQRLYYMQFNGEPGNWNLESTGIYMTQWVDPPEVVVDKNLASLIADKTAMIEQLAAAIETEIETLEILDSLQALTHNGSEDWWAIHKTKLHLRSALRNEIYAQMSLRNSIRELEKASAYYHGDIPAKPKPKPKPWRGRGWWKK